MEKQMSEYEQRHYWRLRWLSSLQAFADADTQGRRWTDPEERNPHFSFVECMCCYFDDTNLSDETAYRQRIERGYLDEVEAKAVVDFHRLADAYNPPNGDDYDIHRILSDAGWHDVVRAAKQAQAKLVALLTDAAEIAALTRPLVWHPEGDGFSGRFPDP